MLIPGAVSWYHVLGNSLTWPVAQLLVPGLIFMSLSPPVQFGFL
jgi:hypothetical protein